MKVHPFVAATALVFVLVLVGVSVLGATLVARRRAARARPPAEPREEPVPMPRARPPVFAALPAPAFSPAPPPPPTSGALRVRIVGPHGLLVPGVSVTAALADDDAGDTMYDLEPANDADGTWSATDLPPGRYAVVATAPDMRTGRAAAVVPSDDVAALALARAALVRGAIGAPGPDGCAGGAVRVKDLSAPVARGDADDAQGLGDQDEDDDAVDVDRDDCTFAIPSPRDEGPLLVTATWGERVEQALVTVPAEGDPAPVCFAPPCPAAPATLAVYVADDAGRLADGAGVEWTLLGDETDGAGGGSFGAGLVFIHDRRAGDTIRVEASIDDARAATTVVVGAGVTDVVLTVAGAPARAVTPRAGRRIRLGDGADVGLR